ncbi:MAG: MotB family protein [Gammaproteobacteria bacterium]
MSEAAPAKPQEKKGAPAWVMTFADLMSLLMCFFVLLLSFSEMDLLKFKQIAGSMKAAFGVQREIKAEDSPRGTSIIAREFTPGRPTPTLIREIRQTTIDETKQTVEFTDAVTEEKNAESIDPNQDSDGSGSMAMQRQPIYQQADTEMPEENPEENRQLANKDEKLADEKDHDENKAEQLAHEQQEKQLANALENQNTFSDAVRLLSMLEEEVEQGLVEIKTLDNRILLRINEKGSFPSGSATVKSSFLPVLKKLRQTLTRIEGNVIVAGHTDNVPIKTARFRSNWELSAARAVTVVHELLLNDALKPERFLIEGHGDGHPIASNDTASDRARNRRVELTIVQKRDTPVSAAAADSVAGQDAETVVDNQISADNPFTSHLMDAETPALTTNIQRILDQDLKPLEKVRSTEEKQSIKGMFDRLRNSLQGKAEQETEASDPETDNSDNSSSQDENDPESIQGKFSAIRDSLMN